MKAVTIAEIQRICNMTGLFAIMYEDSTAFHDIEPEFVCESGDWYWEPSIKSDYVYSKMRVDVLPEDASKCLIKPENEQ